MLHVDVSVPAISKSYEFSLSEHAKISMLIEEIASVIQQKEQRQWQRKIDNLILCNQSNGHTLPMEKTLYECKVSPGSRLLLL